MDAPPRVLFVSKPIVPPWHDGSKNLVRDVAANLKWARPTVLVTEGAPAIAAHVATEAVYRDGGRFAPSAIANARVLARLVRGDPHDAWHFVFAPNPASSIAAQVAIRTRRALGWRGLVVQTIASAPASFDDAARWIFGDVVVVLSEWTRGRLLGAGVRAGKVRVIPPCARAPRVLTTDEKLAVRARHGLGAGPIVLYPGDYEVSRGAETVAAAAVAIARAVPAVKVVFACRAKTPASAEAQARIEAELRRSGAAACTAHLGEVPDMAELLGIAAAVAFPVDDLYGKVDLPLVLLEALSLGVPLVVARGGPLETLTSARLVDPYDGDALAREIALLLTDAAASRARTDAGKDLYERAFSPAIVAAAYDEVYREGLRARAE